MLRKATSTRTATTADHGILDANGKILPEAREPGNAACFLIPRKADSFELRVATNVPTEFLPDTTARTYCRAVETRYDLPTMVSKFMAME